MDGTTGLQPGSGTPSPSMGSAVQLPGRGTNRWQGDQELGCLLSAGSAASLVGQLGGWIGEWGKAHPARGNLQQAARASCVGIIVQKQYEGETVAEMALPLILAC